MLVTFTTKAYADITMFGDIAVSLLKMMGHSGTVPSAILADDVPAALSQLTQSLEARESVDSSPESKVGAESDDNQPPVSLHNRAIPLIALLNAAIQRHADVMWE